MLSFSVLLLMQTNPAEAVVPLQLQKQINLQSVTLDMQNMSCALCGFTIKKALLSVEGVQQASVDYTSKTATVTFDPQKTGSEALIKATAATGYPATVRQTNNLK